MKKINVYIGVFLLLIITALTTPQQEFPFDMKILGDLTVDSSWFMTTRTSGTSDSVLVIEDGQIKYNRSAAGSGDTALWGKNSAYLYTLPQTTRVGIGTGDSPASNLHILDSTGSLGINPYMYSTTAGQYPQLNFGKFNGTPSSFAAVATSTYVGQIGFNASFNATTTTMGARIQAKTTEAWDEDNNGMQLVISTIPENSDALSAHAYFMNDCLGLMNSDPDSTLDVTGGGSFSTDILVGGGWSNWTPTWSWNGGEAGTPPTVIARYMVVNNTVHFYLDAEGTNESGSTSTAFNITLPITPRDVNAFIPCSGLYNASEKSQPTTNMPVVIDAETNLKLYTGTISIANLADYKISISGEYEITSK